MAEPMLFQPGTQFMQSFYAGKERNRQNRLRQIAGEAVTAAPDQRQALTAQAATEGGVEAADDLMTTFSKMDEQGRQNVIRTFEPVARGIDYIARMPPEQQEAAYQQLLAAQEQQGIKVDKYKGVPFAQGKMMFESDFKPLEDILGLGGKSNNAQIEYQKFIEANMTDEEKRQSRLVKGGVGAKPSSAGFSQVKFTGRDGRERVGVMNGRTGRIDMPDGSSFDPGEVQVTSEGQPPQSQPPPQGEAVPPGAFVLPQGEDDKLLAQANAFKQQGIPEELIDAWLEKQMTGSTGQGAAPAQAPPASSQPVTAGADAFVGRTEEESAAATELAKQRAQSQAERESAAPKAAAGIASREARTKDLSAAIDLAAEQAGPWTTGMGSYLEFIRGSGANDLAATIDSIEANLGFDELKDMRDQSPTGGALGSITERELVLLSSVIANLRQSQSAEQFKRNLAKVKASSEAALERGRAAYRNQFGRDYGSPGQPPPAGGNDRASQLIQKWGAR